VLTPTNDASNTLFSSRYQQTYHSTFGAVTESMHVFLKGANVVARLVSGQPTRVLEVGFGLGLNCLLSADTAAQNNTRLDYTGIEHEPISAAQLHTLDYQRWLSKPELVESLAVMLRKPAEPCLKAKLDEHTSVTLIINDATSKIVLEQLATEPAFDAIFLDAFSPEHNPECWTLDFFKQLFSLLTPHGVLATYCVKGTVRRNLQSAGFIVQKVPGPAGKREVLRAIT